MKNCEENVLLKLQFVMNDIGLRTVDFFMTKNLPQLSRVQHTNITTIINIPGLFLMERHIIRMIVFLVTQKTEFWSRIINHRQKLKNAL
jgi:hypothetical protein